MAKFNNQSEFKIFLNQALKYCNSGDFPKAKIILMKLLNNNPSDPELSGLIGTIELQTGNSSSGIKFLRESLKINPNQPNLICNLANAYLELKEIDEAIKNYDYAIELNPNIPNIYYNKARALKEIKNYEEAIINYLQAIKLDPNFILARFNLGFLYNEIGKYELAIKEYTSAINLDPYNYKLFYNRAISLSNIYKFELSISDYNNAINLNPNIDYLYSNKSSALIKIKKFNEALISINAAIEINPNNPDNFNKKAFIYQGEKNFASAIENYDKAISLNSNHYEAISNKSMCLLSLNNFAEGWKIYDARWHSDIKSIYSFTSKPELPNFNITNKNIFIWCEQGIGDHIFFMSLLRDALKTKNFFIVSIDERLLNLASRSFSWVCNVKFVKSTEKIDENLYDFHLPLGSLGKFFRASISDFKKQPVKYLTSDIKKSTFLRNTLKKDNQLVCGISWKSKNENFSSDKSILLDLLVPIFQLPNITFVNIQYGDTSFEINELYNKFNIKIQVIDDIDNFNNIDGLAALIDACDFVITVGNVNAHIAGALNKKTYLLLPYSHGKMWYWREYEDDSLWYSSIKIFRQNISNSWTLPLNNLYNELKVTYDR